MQWIKWTGWANSIIDHLYSKCLEPRWWFKSKKNKTFSPLCGETSPDVTVTKCVHYEKRSKMLLFSHTVKLLCSGFLLGAGDTLYGPIIPDDQQMIPHTTHLCFLFSSMVDIKTTHVPPALLLLRLRTAPWGSSLGFFLLFLLLAGQRRWPVGERFPTSAQLEKTSGNFCLREQHRYKSCEGELTRRRFY